jgi:Fe-S-cluster-containing hydrogenase component 2
VANCHDCYACVRACPVKAIRVNVGHAEVVEELCILDGACVAACPQGAKQVEQHGERVEAYLRKGEWPLAWLLVWQPLSPLNQGS